MVRDILLLKVIAALDKNEKQYFSALSKERSGQEHLLLYKKLNHLIASSDQEISSIPDRIKKKIKNYSRAKQTLYRQLMRALRLKYEKFPIENELNTKIHEAYLLKKKGLAIQSNQQFEIVKKEAVKYECHQQICAILDHQLMLSMNNLKKGMMDRVLTLHEERERTLQHMLAVERFEKCRHQAFLLFRCHGDIRQEELAKRVEHLIELLLKTEHQAPTFFAQNACFDALALLYRLKMDKQNALRNYQKMLTLWNQKEYLHFKKKYPDRYKLHIYNYLNTLQWAKEYEEFDKWLDEARRLLPVFLDDEVEDFQNIEFLNFLKLINTNQFLEAQKMVPEIETQLLTYADKVESMIESRKITWFYNIAVFYFIIEKFDLAETWFLRLFSLTASREQRNDLKSLSKIFLLIINHEKGGHQDEELVQQSTRRYLDRHNAYFTFEKQLLDQLKSLSALNGDLVKKQAILTSLLEYLQKIKKENIIRNGIEEINLWVRSRLENKLIIDLL